MVFLNGANFGNDVYMYMYITLAVWDEIWEGGREGERGEREREKDRVPGCLKKENGILSLIRVCCNHVNIEIWKSTGQ